MKTIFILIATVICLIIFLLFVLGKYSQRGHAPGLVNGTLTKCSTKPNCICSEYSDDTDHYVKPIKISPNDGTFDISKVSATIQEIGGTIHQATDEYIAATFKSSIFGFIDDLEIRKDQTQEKLHIRSASRVGYSDAGVNRKRVELFKKIYNQKIEKSNNSPLDHKTEM